MVLQEENDCYVSVSGMKGLWTLEEVISLLQDNKIKFRIVMSTNDSQYQSNVDELPNQVEDRR